MALTIISTLVVIGVLVFIHELGHFLAAKWAGIHVHRFSLGLGAPIPWLSFTRNGTEYSVSWLPLGGYVKMATEMEGSEASLEGGREPGVVVPPDRLFEAKPVWVRMVVILAGVVMNGLFAWAIFSGLVYVNGAAVWPTTTVAAVDAGRLPAGASALAEVGFGDRIVAVNGAAVATWQDISRAVLEGSGSSVTLAFEGRPAVTLELVGDVQRIQALSAIQPYFPPVISTVVENRPGAAAGLVVGDTVLAFDGVRVRTWGDMVGLIEGRAGQPVTIEVGRAGGRQAVSATPAPEEIRDSTGVRTVGRLGIAGPLVPDSREPIGLGASILRGGRQTLAVGGLIVGVVRGMFSGAVSTREVGGPIAIGVMAGESARLGPAAFLAFMAMISVNLAILNLLPIPILDGGQFLFLLAEGITRRPVSGKLREWLTMAGLVAIGMLMVLAFSNDIRRLLGL